MATQTEMEARAERLGWPLGVQGYGPNETGYYSEESLGWVSHLLNPHRHGLSPEQARAALARLVFLPLAWNENMAPRFPSGTSLAGRRVQVGQPVIMGSVLCFWEPGDAKDCPVFARVVSLDNGQLRLACDNGGHPYRLPWVPEAARRVGRVYVVTHYSSLPYPDNG